MQRLHSELKDEGFEILAVDLQESREQVRRFVDELDPTFTILMDKTGTVYSTTSFQRNDPEE